MRIQSRKVTAARVRRFFWLLRHLWSGYCALDMWDGDGRVTFVGATKRSVRDLLAGHDDPDMRVFWSSKA